jgi:hypothetical protein
MVLKATRISPSSGEYIMEDGERKKKSHQDKEESTCYLTMHGPGDILLLLSSTE